MHMSFDFGYNLKNLLFQNLNVTSIEGLVLACVCVFGFALLYESLKMALAAVKLNSAILKVPKRQQCFSDDMVLIASRSNARRHLWTYIEGLIYAVELSVGYIIMLLIMTFNVYLIVSVILAAGLCYFVFGHRHAEIKMKTSKLKLPCEHCMKHQSSMTSSSEAIPGGTRDLSEGSCCSH